MAKAAAFFLGVPRPRRRPHAAPMPWPPIRVSARSPIHARPDHDLRVYGLPTE